MSSDIDWLSKNILDESVNAQLLVEHLLKTDKALTIKNEEFYALLLDANQITVLSVALEGGWIDPNFKDDEGLTPIGYCLYKATEQAREFVSHDRVVDSYDRIEQPATTSEKIIQLLHAGANPNGPIYSDFSPLDICLSFHLPHLAAILLIFGAEANLSIDPDSLSPLEAARRSKKTEWFTQLVEQTAT